MRACHNDDDDDVNIIAILTLMSMTTGDDGEDDDRDGDDEDAEERGHGDGDSDSDNRRDVDEADGDADDDHDGKDAGGEDYDMTSMALTTMAWRTLLTGTIRMTTRIARATRSRLLDRFARGQQQRTRAQIVGMSASSRSPPIACIS